MQPHVRQAEAGPEHTLLLAAIGALGGASAWFVLEELDTLLTNQRLLLAAPVAVGVFFLSLLAMAGPLRLTRAAPVALLCAAAATLLAVWASFRFDEVGPFIETAKPTAALIILVGLAQPFLIAAQRHDQDWANYAALFDNAWGIVIRGLWALIFAILVWGVLMLSDGLLKQVGITLISRLLEEPAAGFVITGLSVGLAVGAALDRRIYASPHLALGLLRLLLPPVLLVTVVFLAAMVPQALAAGGDLGEIFGEFSAASVLMSMTFMSILLVTSALDRGPAEAVQARPMRIMARLLALTVPAMAGLALFAVLLRVSDHGWTPERLAAVSAAGMLCAYGVVYAVTALVTRDWMRHLRRGNTALALLTILLAALWLTPVLDAQRISARDQLARILDGRAAPEPDTLWLLGHDLGRAGTVALARLEERSEDAELIARIERLRETELRYEFLQDEQGETVRARRIEDDLTVVPAGAVLPEGTMDDVPEYQQSMIVDGCETRTPGGRPGCLAVVADFLTDRPGNEVLFVFQLPTGGMMLTAPHEMEQTDWGLSYDYQRDVLEADLIDRLVEEGVTLVPAPVQFLRLPDGPAPVTETAPQDGGAGDGSPGEPDAAPGTPESPSAERPGSAQDGPEEPGGREPGVDMPGSGTSGAEATDFGRQRAVTPGPETPDAEVEAEPDDS
ncbi:DUF4153 domain-containing protein [Mesobaculum littorinae]|uniref:DUF4153 domain-containing protein n=1 Tax=Mesobaculum littorinae TaxID=2486419 RepID=A0A438AJC8_9RHOB|nr:DUF4153 domain-containing protein [Mesobaculum littorinae]RVV98810.1 DUF4153 domain-containing protein [Mesobaculum littorinae]